MGENISVDIACSGDADAAVVVRGLAIDDEPTDATSDVGEADETESSRLNQHGAAVDGDPALVVFGCGGRSRGEAAEKRALITGGVVVAIEEVIKGVAHFLKQHGLDAGGVVPPLLQALAGPIQGPGQRGGEALNRRPGQRRQPSGMDCFGTSCRNLMCLQGRLEAWLRFLLEGCDLWGRNHRLDLNATS